MIFRFIARFLGRYSLKKMFIICVVCFIIMPFAGITSVIQQQAGSLIYVQTQENMLQNLVQTQENVGNLLKEAENVSVEVLSDRNVQTYIKYYRDPAPAEMDALAAQQYTLERENLKFKTLETLGKLFAAHTRIKSLYISDAEAYILRYGETVNNEDTPYHRLAMERAGQVVWTPPYVEYNQHMARDKMIVSCIRQIRDLDSLDYLALERVSIDEAELCKVFSYEDSTDTFERFIIDRQGTVISAADKSLLGSMAPGVDASKIGDGAGFADFTQNGAAKSMSFVPIRNTDWVLVQVCPREAITQPMRAVNAVILVFIIVFLLFALFFIAIQNSCIVHPLACLSDEMEKVKQGIFHPEIDIPSNNEIGRLTFLFLDMTDRLEMLFESVYKAKLHTREAELRALQSQINPHFLYNSLDAIYWLAYQNKDFEVGRQIEALSNLFRHTLNSGAEITTIRAELKHLSDYMYLQRSKTGDRVRLELDVDESLYDARIIKLVVQPLVENALYHGLECKEGEGFILVSIKRHGSDLVMTVSDDGLGADQEKIRAMLLDDAQAHNAFALKNIESRIKLKHGEQYGMVFSSKPGVGTTVVITMPLEAEEPTKGER